MKKYFFYFISFALIATIVVVACQKEKETFQKQDKLKFNTSQRDDGQSQDPCEGGSGGNCTGTYNIVSANVAISDYPGCTFEVTYKIRSCPVGLMDIIILYIDDMEPGGSDPSMSAQFQADIDSLDASNHPVTFELFYDNFENKIGKALTLQLTANNAPPCGGTNQPMTVSFISGHCNYTCYYKTNEEGGKSKYVTTGCGDVCCEQKYSVCMDNGTPVITKVGSTTPYGNCQPSNWPRPCPEYTFYRSTCKEKCRFNF